MSLTIELSPKAEAGLNREAARSGLSLHQFATRLIAEKAGAPTPETPIVTDDPAGLPFEELSLRRFESEAFSKAYLHAATEQLNRLSPTERAALEREDEEYRDRLNENRRLSGQYGML